MLSQRLSITIIEIGERLVSKSKANKGFKILLLFTGKKWWDDGVSADFLVRLIMNKENKIELDAWQAVIDDGGLRYCLRIMHENRNSFHHLDFAYHQTPKYGIEKLFDRRINRPELSDKSNIFRINSNQGRISFDFAFSLMTEFFPLDELIDEYYLKETVGQSEIN